jgi:hypothetical protein
MADHRVADGGASTIPIKPAIAAFEEDSAWPFTSDTP